MQTRIRTYVLAAIALSGIFPLNSPAQSLWHDETSKPMFADKRATGVGDILTILIQESTSASKKNNTTTGKEASMDAAIASFLYSPAASGLLTKGGTLPAIKYDAKNNFTGGGSVDNSQNIAASVAVKVIDVLPNKNLVIEGRRETSFSGEHQTIVLHGIVRSEDVAANNTIYSYNIAEAKVEITGKGAVDDNQRRGWITRVWDKINPF